MGEVYRARAAKLNRDVALKILPDTFAIDPDRDGALPARGAGPRLAQSLPRKRRADAPASKPGESRPTTNSLVPRAAYWMKMNRTWKMLSPRSALLPLFVFLFWYSAMSCRPF